MQTEVLIIGAGFGGLAMGVALQKAGHQDFMILEKHSSVGGVWAQNRYPGCTCDVPSHLYSFSFAPYRSRSTRYPSQQDILEYLEQVAEDYCLQSHIYLDTEVTEAHFQQASKSWVVKTANKRHIHATTIIFAVGQLHRPNYPIISGLSEFGGKVIHSAEWNDAVDFQDRSVGIIGTGSSAVQMLPKLAPICSDLHIFQRTPSWILPKPSSEFGMAKSLFLRIPGAHRFYRNMLRHSADLLLSPLTRSATWRCIVERYALNNLHRKINDKETIEKLTPSYPIGSKRVLLDNHFYESLRSNKVHLVTEPIKLVNNDGIQIESGKVIKTDIIVCATGFKASQFLVPMNVTGRDGHILNKDWASGAEAFLGLAVHGYPNLFLLAGPNSFNPAGSNPDMKELQVAYIMKCLDWKRQNNAQSIEVSKQASTEYREWLGLKMEKTVWSHSVDSWYKHENGKITNPWPESRRTFARMLQRRPQKSFVISGEQKEMEDFKTSDG